MILYVWLLSLLVTIILLLLLLLLVLLLLLCVCVCVGGVILNLSICVWVDGGCLYLVLYCMCSTTGFSVFFFFSYMCVWLWVDGGFISVVVCICGDWTKEGKFYMLEISLIHNCDSLWWWGGGGGGWCFYIIIAMMGVVRIVWSVISLMFKMDCIICGCWWVCHPVCICVNMCLCVWICVCVCVVGGGGGGKWAVVCWL